MCVCWYVSCGCLFKLLPLLSVCLSSFIHTFTLPLSCSIPFHSLHVYLLSHSWPLSYLFSHYTALSSQQTPSPLHPLTHLHTTLPLLLSTHHPFLSLSLPLSIYHLPFPFSLPYCRISSSFLTCQVMKFKMAYRRHFGSGLHVPTKKGKSFV